MVQSNGETTESPVHLTATVRAAEFRLNFAYNQIKFSKLAIHIHVFL